MYKVSEHTLRSARKLLKFYLYAMKFSPLKKLYGYRIREAKKTIKELDNYLQ